MKKITIILLFTILIVSASVNKSEGSSKIKPNTYSLTYAEVASTLSSSGYSIISVPPGYTPDMNISAYPGTILYLYYKASTTSYVEVYRFPTAASAEAATSDPTVCTQKWNSSGQTTGCFDAGNQCKVIANADPNKVKVICCG